MKKISVFALALGMAGVAAAQTDAKGIFLDQGDNHKSAVQFDVTLTREGQQARRVPSNFRFVTGDKMKFNFTVNRDSYVYVLHRTVNGNPDDLGRYVGAKGIEIIRDDDRRESNGAPKYQLLFPTRATGTNNRALQGRAYTIPTGEAKLELDDNPGLEKLFIVVSDSPIDVSKFYNVSGEVRGAADRQPSRRSNTADSDDDVTSRLTDWAKNTDVQMSKGLNIVESYGIVVDRSRPSAFAVDLKHYRR